jgi:hypothetical protein
MSLQVRILGFCVCWGVGEAVAGSVVVYHAPENSVNSCGKWRNRGIAFLVGPATDGISLGPEMAFLTGGTSAFQAFESLVLGRKKH